MDLKSPLTLLVAWLLVPGLVVVASTGLGLLLASLAGLRLGALTLPAGFLAGISIMTFALEVGVSGVVAVVIAAGCALAGFVAWLLTHRPRLRDLMNLRNLRQAPDWLWAAAIAVSTYAIGIAALVGTGRSGILGYVLNNDPSVHVSVIELLRDNGAAAEHGGLSSYHAAATLFEGGYPLGSYPWVLFGGVTGGIDAFHIWTPMIAVASAMTALVAFWILRGAGAPRLLAAPAATLIAGGYLPYSYLAQGGAKEVLTALTIYGTVALFVLAVQVRFDWRGLIPAAVGAAAAIHNLGLGAGAWLGPAGVVATAYLLWRTRGRRSRQQVAITLTVGALMAAIVAMPSILSSLDYISSTEDQLVNPAQTGNLVGPVPWSEAFNVWLGADYRFSKPDRETLTAIGVLLAALLAAAGAVFALRRRQYGVLLAAFTGIAGAVLISRRYAIYFDAKAYMALAPALGLLTATGVLSLISGSRRRERIGGIALGILVAAGVAASDAYVYAGTWMTPKDRFQEMIDIAERFEGQGPMLVNEREEYSKFFLRDSNPWESWGFWQPNRGLRFPTVPPVPVTPDFDHYTPEHVRRFELLLERRRPGGSAPPSNYRVVDETKHYRVWKRSGDPPAMHVALGLHGLSGAGRLDCRDREVRSLLAQARRSRARIRVAYPPPVPVVSRPAVWDEYAHWGPTPTKGFVSWHSGFAVAEPPLSRDRYFFYAQGSFGPGLRVYLDGQPVGEALADLGLQDGWQPLGAARVSREQPSVVIVSLDKPRWRPGSRRLDIGGPLAFVREPERRRQAEIGVAAARRLCGRRLDWLELVSRR